MRHPWGSGRCDISDIKLTSDQKDFLADLVISNRMETKEVARQFNLSHNKLNYYVYRRRKSSKNYNFRGRSKSIDDISDSFIKNKIALYGATSINNLKRVIKEEGLKTYKRKHPNFISKDKRKSLFISHRSIKRYYEYYMNIYLSNLVI
jgi:hypothetical protein